MQTQYKSLPTKLHPYLLVGKDKRQEFEEVITEFFTDGDSHYYIKGRAGLGKTYTVMTQAEKNNALYIPFPGKQSIWGFTKRLAVSLHALGWPSYNNDRPNIKKLPLVCVHIDDCPQLFDEDFVNMLKIALDEKQYDYLDYSMSLSGQYNQCEPHEKIAIDHFKEETRSGFRIPFYEKVKFIFTMNHALNDTKDLEIYQKTTGIKASKTIVKNMEDRAALFSRVQYWDFSTNKEETWGWLADLIINANLCQGAKPVHHVEMLQWIWDKWPRLREASARSVVSKMWKLKSKSLRKKDKKYLARWDQLVK